MQVISTLNNQMRRIGRSSYTPEDYYNSIATLYDREKKKNLYYFENLVTLYKSLIPVTSTIIDIGCGTGDLTVALGTRKATGLDLSVEMIKVAQKKYRGLRNVCFEQCNIYTSNELFKTNYIIMADVLEHIIDLPNFLHQIFVRTPNQSHIIISVINPIWEPVMILAEKLNLKIPEGPHKRLSVAKTEKLFEEAGFKILQTGYRFLIPKKLPFSDLVNRNFYKNKLLARYGLTLYWILSK